MRGLNRTFLRTIRFKLLFGLLLVIVPLVGLLIYNNFYAIQIIRNQVMQSNVNMMSLYMGRIDASLKEVDNYLYALAATNTDLLQLDVPEKRNPNEYNISKIALAKKINTDINSYKSIDSFIIYSRENDDMMITEEMSQSYDYRKVLNDSIQSWLRTDPGSKGNSGERWRTYCIGNEYFLYHIVKAGNVDIVGWVNVKKIMVPLELIQLGQDGRAVLIDETDSSAMNDRDYVSEHGIDLKSDRLTGSNGKFLVAGAQSSLGPFSLAAVIPDSAILERLSSFKDIIAVICIGSVIAIPFVLLFFQRLILLPVRRIVSAMKQVKLGNWEARIEPSPSSVEFELMHESFNTMIRTVQELTISVYEEKISKQTAELMHLQLQINPHFFMNTINMIYNSAQVRDYPIIQELSLALVRYFRYMLLQGDRTQVPLRDEVEQLINYLRIQEMRYGDSLTYELSAPEELLDRPVPPLLVQTFVENTIKHTLTMDEPVHLQIDICSANGDGTGLRLLIRDTGNGFPDEVLHRLAVQEDVRSERGEHVGIWNAMHRLRLLYGDRADIKFANGEEWGAEIRITLP
ncbi:sensor histidine kinase [Cohnella terricola]|uniref:HAMP domain-containing protein n=1 Tax=Cohnella terricola TaxID=1289167 RepID=A0A559JWF1_9BACL|nr:histidine kinase [Cohnella terricola]TVY04222.1 HAMP domain-containing protein [Cohnella terricola]